MTRLERLALLALVSLAVGISLVPAAFAEPAIEVVATSPAIRGDPVSVRVTGVEPGTSIELTVQMVGREGEVWGSAATFFTSAGGDIDIRRDAPTSGSYAGVDPLGLFWSMDPQPETSSRLPKERHSLFQFSAKADGEIIASADYEPYVEAPGVTVQSVSGDGLVGRLYRPASNGDVPGVLLLGGSGGGLPVWQLTMAGILASHGYATLALGYFKLPGLPPTLNGVPLEYFQTAITWMESQPGLDAERLGVIGVSRGGELALILGSRFPKIKAVVAYVPGSMVGRSLGPGPFAVAWSWQGTPLKQETIPVEKINGPVLLISGGRDALWHSSLMSRNVMYLLEQAGHPHRFEHLDFPEAGHGIMGPGYGPSPAAFARRFGGTRAANAHALAEGWSAVLDFLGEVFE